MILLVPFFGLLLIAAAVMLVGEVLLLGILVIGAVMIVYGLGRDVVRVVRRRRQRRAVPQARYSSRR